MHKHKTKYRSDCLANHFAISNHNTIGGFYDETLNVAQFSFITYVK